MEFISTRRFREIERQRDVAQSNADSYEELMPYLELAMGIRQDTQAFMDSPEGAEVAHELAVKKAYEVEKNRLAERFAADIKVVLTENQKAEVVQDFINTRLAKVEAEVTAEVEAEEGRVRQTINSRVEMTIRQKKREELLEMINTDESKKTLQKIGEQTIASANKELLLTKLRDKAKTLECFDILDLPADTAFSIGLNTPEESPNGHYSGRYYLNNCERILRLRVVDPVNGILDVLSDSWSNSNDNLKKHNSIPDLSEIHLPKRESSTTPRINLGSIPHFTNPDGQKIEMYALETNCINVGEESII